VEEGLRRDAPEVRAVTSDAVSFDEDDVVAERAQPDREGEATRSGTDDDGAVDVVRVVADHVGTSVCSISSRRRRAAVLSAFATRGAPGSGRRHVPIINRAERLRLPSAGEFRHGFEFVRVRSPVVADTVTPRG
jgi:hypothetical protein